MASPATYPWRSYLPLRTVYQLAYTISVVARIPLWLVVSLVPALRPLPTWTFRQTLGARISRAVVDMVSEIGITESVSLEPGKEGDRFQVLAPAPSELYKGPMVSSSSSSDVRPAPIGATWYPAKPKVDPNSTKKLRVALHLHGGAFVMGQSREGYNGFAARTLLKHADLDAVLTVSYRLSGYDNTNPFPAALQDALTSYLHLTRELQLSPQQIILVGDSAGGNLVVALLRYIEEYGHEALELLGGLPNRGRPGGALLVSPWVDPLTALGPDDAVFTSTPRWKTDYLPVSFLRWGARAYGGEALRGDAYVTPLGHAFATPVPMMLVVGEAEIFQAVVLEWAEQMKAVAGNQLDVHVEADAVHDTILLGGILGWDESIGCLISKLKPRIHAMTEGN